MGTPYGEGKRANRTSYQKLRDRKRRWTRQSVLIFLLQIHGRQKRGFIGAGGDALLIVEKSVSDA